jgi:hypothetical protein
MGIVRPAIDSPEGRRPLITSRRQLFGEEKNIGKTGFVNLIRRVTRWRC